MLPPINNKLSYPSWKDNVKYFTCSFSNKIQCMNFAYNNIPVMHYMEFKIFYTIFTVERFTSHKFMLQYSARPLSPDPYNALTWNDTTERKQLIVEKHEGIISATDNEYSSGAEALDVTIIYCLWWYKVCWCWKGSLLGFERLFRLQVSIHLFRKDYVPVTQ